MCCVEEGSKLGFRGWLRATGGVLENSLKRRTVTMAMGMATGCWTGEVTGLQYGISVDSLLNIRGNEMERRQGF